MTSTYVANSLQSWLPCEMSQYHVRLRPPQPITTPRPAPSPLSDQSATVQDQLERQIVESNRLWRAAQDGLTRGNPMSASALKYLIASLPEGVSLRSPSGRLQYPALLQFRGLSWILHIASEPPFPLNCRSLQYPSPRATVLRGLLLGKGVIDKLRTTNR